MDSDADDQLLCKMIRRSTDVVTRSVSPNEKCAICLCPPENRSYTDSCFHEFCFVCLVEWSKVKAECPLCKQQFKSIIHNIKSISEFEEFEVKREAAQHGRAAAVGVSTDLNSASFGYDEHGNRFRYNSTMTAERMELIRHIRSLRSRLSHVRHYEQNQHQLKKELERLQRLHHLYVRSATRPEVFTASLEFRRMVYERGMRVKPLEESQMTPADDSIYIVSYRDTSPEFYRENPAQMHRLLRWLSRELNVFFNGHFERINFVCEFICHLITRHEICSSEFRRRLGVLLLHRTDHFIHEFYHFARSPLEMDEYDRRVSYTPAIVTSVSPETVEIDQLDSPDRNELVSQSISVLPLEPDPAASLSASSRLLTELRRSVQNTRERLSFLQRNFASSSNDLNNESAGWRSRPESEMLTSISLHNVSILSSDNEVGPMNHITRLTSASASESDVEPLWSEQRCSPITDLLQTPRNTTIEHNIDQSSSPWSGDVSPTVSTLLEHHLRNQSICCPSSPLSPWSSDSDVDVAWSTDDYSALNNKDDEVQIIAELKPKALRTPEVLNLGSSDDDYDTPSVKKFIVDGSDDEPCCSKFKPTVAGPFATSAKQRHHSKLKDKQRKCPKRGLNSSLEGTSGEQQLAVEGIIIDFRKRWSNGQQIRRPEGYSDSKKSRKRH